MLSYDLDNFNVTPGISTCYRNYQILALLMNILLYSHVLSVLIILLVDNYIHYSNESSFSFLLYYFYSYSRWKRLVCPNTLSLFMSLLAVPLGGKEIITVLFQCGFYLNHSYDGKHSASSSAVHWFFRYSVTLLVYNSCFLLKQPK